MEKQHTNRLSRETSPYLLQHAHNPVDWYPWGEEALAKAKKENRPLLVSIGYSACHWCHVMEQESFEDSAIAGLMNELFVNVKVDREERPDLDEVYMNAVQLLTGHGGWPLTVFLTPDGEPFFGGTYFPPADRYGVPGFPRVLKAVAQAFREKPDEVRKKVEQIQGALKKLSSGRESTRSFSRETLTRAAEHLGQAYDAEDGGLGRAPKFPNVGVFELFLRHYRHGREGRFLEMARHTLSKMALGGIYDHLGGGFHRYSVDDKWLVPHFEKMLYDNAQLLRLYAQAFCLTREPLLLRVAEETAGYLLREMLGPGGGFYSAQDADSEGEEGKFYVWSHEEVVRILGSETAEIFCRLYDVTEQGNFEGRNILHPVLSFEQGARYFGKTVEEIETVVGRAKEKLFQEREKRIKPFRDEKIIAAWNGLALSGLAEIAKLTGDPETIRGAVATAEFIGSKMTRDGRLLHTYKDGVAKLDAYLDDYAFVGVGLVDLFETAHDPSLLARAVRLADVMIEEFWDKKGGGFFYTGESHEKLIARTKPAFDGSIPSGNSAAAQLLLRLYHYTTNEDYLGKAEKLLKLHYDQIEQQPFGLTHMLAALDFYLEKPKEIVVVGDKKNPATLDLLRNIHSLYLPNKTLQVVEPGGPRPKLPPPLASKGQLNGETTAYVCQHFTCSRPATKWEEVRALLES
jgi:hypothetical protein